jgi:hypothetical protein
MATKAPPPAPIAQHAAEPAPSAPPPSPQPEPKTSVAAVAPTVAPAPPPPAPPLPDNDVDAWSVVKDASDPALLRRFTTKFPNSFLRPAAEARATALVAVRAAWDLMKDSNDPDQLRQFIRHFPSSPERAAAEQRLVALGAPLDVPAPIAATPKPAAPAPAAPAPITAAPAAPATAALTPPTSTPDPHELARALQFELMRVGCFIGKVTGDFDDDTKAAWHKFIKRTSKDMPDDASPDAIKTVRTFDKRVCPLACPHGQHADDEVCVADEPEPKHNVKREPERERPRAAPEREPAAAAAPAKSPCTYVPDRGASSSGMTGQKLGCN